MKVKVYQLNNQGKIEFSRADLEALLNEVYSDGYKEGQHSVQAYSAPCSCTYTCSCTESDANAVNVEDVKISEPMSVKSAADIIATLVKELKELEL